MQKIGNVLSISDAVISTNDGYIEKFVIFESSIGTCRSQILMEVWEVGKGDGPVVGELIGTATSLPAGVCHTFQWRLEEQLEEFEDEDDDWELIDADEAIDPSDLIHNFPDELIDVVTRTVNAWLDNEYAAMNSEVQ